LPAERSDGWITLKVKTALAFHKHVSATQTEVETKDGVVTLRGEAKDAAERDLVGKLAADTEGVKGVNNRMTLRHS
jgi:osmotically-inducible protein OsmY